MLPVEDDIPASQEVSENTETYCKLLTHFYAPGLRGPPGHLVIGSSICLSVRPSLRNSIPLTNKV